MMPVTLQEMILLWLIAILRAGVLDHLLAQWVNEGETCLCLCQPTVMAISHVFMLISSSKEWVTAWGQRPPTVLLTECVPLHEGKKDQERQKIVNRKPFNDFLFKFQSFCVKLVNLEHHTYYNFLHSFSVLSIWQPCDIQLGENVFIDFIYKSNIDTSKPGPSALLLYQQQDTGLRLEILFLGYPRGDGLIQENRITEILLNLFLSSLSCWSIINSNLLWNPRSNSPCHKFMFFS